MILSNINSSGIKVTTDSHLSNSSLSLLRDKQLHSLSMTKPLKLVLFSPQLWGSSSRLQTCAETETSHPCSLCTVLENQEWSLSRSANLVAMSTSDGQLLRIMEALLWQTTNSPFSATTSWTPNSRTCPPPWEWSITVTDLKSNTSTTSSNAQSPWQPSWKTTTSL